jgi:hypothetical protein
MKDTFWKTFAAIALISMLAMFFTYIGSRDRYNHFQKKSQWFGRTSCTDYVIDQKTGKIYELDDGEICLIGVVPKEPNFISSCWKSLTGFFSNLLPHKTAYEIWKEKQQKNNKSKAIKWLENEVKKEKKKTNLERLEEEVEKENASKTKKQKTAYELLEEKYGK